MGGGEEKEEKEAPSGSSRRTLLFYSSSFPFFVARDMDAAAERQLQAAIIAYLRKKAAALPAHAEGLEVAAGCLVEAFGVEGSSSASSETDLLQAWKAGTAAGGAAAGSASPAGGSEKLEGACAKKNKGEWRRRRGAFHVDKKVARGQAANHFWPRVLQAACGAPRRALRTQAV